MICVRGAVVVEDCSDPIIEFEHGRHGCAGTGPVLRKVLAQKPIGVLVGAALPRTLRSVVARNCA
jgi:hypothetical protein